MFQKPQSAEAHRVGSLLDGGGVADGMNLRSGASIWVELAKPTPCEVATLRRHVRCKFAIVGAGITGALLADRLCHIAGDVVLVDSRGIGLGSTAASTSLLLCEPDTHFVDLSQRFGREAARRIHGLGQYAIERIEALAAEFPLACGFARRSSLYVASRDADSELLEREHALRESLHLPVEFLTGDELRRAGYSLRHSAALRSPIAAEINAYELTHSLIERSTRAGLRVYCGTRVLKPEAIRAGSIVLRTDGGQQIHADAVVFASGYEAHQQLSRDLGTLASTWVFASEPVDGFAGWPDRALIWETARPYIYLRTTSDNRIIVGGADEPFIGAHADESQMPAKVSGLAARFGSLFPDIEFRVASAWAGVFGNSRDGLPYIGRPDPRMPQYFALGYGGNGITYSLLAAEIIADQLQSRRHEDEDLFSFAR